MKLFASYGDKIRDHFEHPRNVGALDENDPQVGTGLVGTLAERRIVKLQLRLDKESIIEETKFKAYGCGATIAAVSLLSESVKGCSLAEARVVSSDWIAQELALPAEKIYCAVLAEQALAAALDNLAPDRGNSI